MDDRKPLRIRPTTLDLAWKDPEENLRRIRGAIREGGEESLYLFPELTLTGFVTQDPGAYAIDLQDDQITALRDIAREHKTGIVAGFPERNPHAPDKPFNALALIEPSGEINGLYRKMHLFTLGKNPESRSYSAGNACLLTRYRGWRIGFAICFDVRFPRMFHPYAKGRADLVLASACWVGGEHKTYQYRTLNSAHAILTQSYVAAVNRSGKDPAFEYDGAQYVFSPFGEDVYQKEGVLLDEAVIETCRNLQVRPSDLKDYPLAGDA